MVFLRMHTKMKHCLPFYGGGFKEPLWLVSPPNRAGHQTGHRAGHRAKSSEVEMKSR